MIFEEDVRSFHEKCKERKPGYPSEKQVDHLQASPPCQGFSLANRGGGRNDRKNNLLSLEVLRSFAILKPRTGILENVQGMIRPKHLNYIFQILHESIALGYQVRLALHNADEFGGAQKRKRVIFTFARNDTMLPELPITTNQSEAKILDDVLQGLPIDCDMETGSGLVRLPNRDLTFNHIASYPRADGNILDRYEAVNTLTTQNSASLAHPDNPDRTLSMRELARLFSYPDDKQFFGKLTAIRKQIGNSVPVNLAQAIALPIFRVHKSRKRVVETHPDGEASGYIDV